MSAEAVKEKEEPKIDPLFTKKLSAGIKVTTVYLHQAFNIVGMTTTSLYAKKSSFVMALHPEGVYAVTDKGAPFFVPAANIIAALL